MILEVLLSAALAMPAQPTDSGQARYTDLATAHRVSRSSRASAAPTTLPSSSRRPRVVTVVKGDTLSKLARELKLPSWRPLFDANHKIRNPNLIFVGQRLRVPRVGERLKPRQVPLMRATTPRRQHHRVTTARRPRVARQAPARAKPNYARGNTVWDRLAKCESSGNWSINTGNGFYGGLQFTLSSWRATGGSGYPHRASRAEQIRRAKVLLRMQGWGAWPACSSRLGLR